MATWHTPESARAGWIGAPADTVLADLLEVAKGEIVAYAPPLDPDAESIPEGYRWAQIQHARNVWNAATANPAGSFGADGEGFGLTIYPLDWSIKQRLRPRVIFGGSVA